jgi:subtilisin-like proprotein convertase family protein
MTLSTPTSATVISGSAENGILLLDVDNNIIAGNYIGTSLDRQFPLRNALAGVRALFGSANNRIGTNSDGIADAEERNLVSVHSSDAGIVLSGFGTTGNIVAGNYIGTDARGESALPNDTGIRISNDASNNTIGGTAAGAGNIIAFNQAPSTGVYIESGTGNAVLSNSIYSNGGLGIDLGQGGVTANDNGDGDGAEGEGGIPGNNLQNFPVLTYAVTNGESASVTGTLNSTPNSSFNLQFFSNVSCDDSGHGEGRNFIGTTTVNTDANGNAAFDVPVRPEVLVGQFITATATDNSLSDTSEFSACVQVESPGPGRLRFGAASYSVAENGEFATINVARVGGRLGTVTVDFATGGGTATGGNDYTPASGTLTFADNETSQTFTIPILNDLAIEGDETIGLALSNATGGAVIDEVNSSSVLIIVDDETIFSNPAIITIPDSGAATPYPSDINVSGLSGTVNRLTVTLGDLSHTFPADINVLLVSPSGQKVVLMSGTGGGNTINNVTLTFDDAAAQSLPADGTIVSGTYRPTVASGEGDIPNFPPPAPPGPYAQILSAFNGSNPNGTWSLYVFDSVGGDAGQIAGGWSLNITPSGPPACVTPPSQMTAWYPGDGNASDIQGGNNGTLQNGATFAAGKVAQAFSFDGVDDSVSFGNTVANFGTSDFTVDFWINSARSDSLKKVWATGLIAATVISSASARKGRAHWSLRWTTAAAVTSRLIPPQHQRRRVPSHRGRAPGRNSFTLY